jgi:hypothetical protein
MNSTPTPKAIEPHNPLVVRADEQIERDPTQRRRRPWTQLAPVLNLSFGLQLLQAE